MSKIGIPNGYALIRVEDLAALLAAKPPAAPAASSVTATMPALGEAIALIAARANGIGGIGLSGDVAPGAVAAALATVAAALLAALLPEPNAAGLLHDLGLIAAKERNR